MPRHAPSKWFSCSALVLCAGAVGGASDTPLVSPSMSGLTVGGSWPRLTLNNASPPPKVTGDNHEILFATSTI